MGKQVKQFVERNREKAAKVLRVLIIYVCSYAVAEKEFQSLMGHLKKSPEY